VSGRLGAALAEHIRRMPGRTKFILLEGVDESLALAIARAWRDDLPRLAVASDRSERFGKHALSGVSGTGLRNLSATGVVLVVCTGHQVPDRQSLSRFASLEPGDLLRDPEGFSELAHQPPAAPLDGPVRVVRQAIMAAGAAERPSAAKVAAYFDELAAGGDPLEHLPTLGAFADHAAGAAADLGRISDNFQLAGRRRAEEVLRPSASGELRRRAERVLARRPNLAQVPRTAANRFMELLQSGSDELLRFVTFDEAREILEERSFDLSSAAGQELADYQRAHPDNRGIQDLPWPGYFDHCRKLRRPDTRRDSALALLTLDDGENKRVFQTSTRRKLERLLRDRSISASSPSCPEAGLVRAATELGGAFDRVQLLEPVQLGDTTSGSGAVRALTLACARLRLGGLLRKLQSDGATVDGLLLRPSDEGISDDTFRDADLSAPGQLAIVRLRLHNGKAETVQLDWRPDLDDAALLRAALLFREQPALTFSCGDEPSLADFCQTSRLEPLAVAMPLRSLAGKLMDMALAVVEHGVTPQQLLRWVAAWRNAVDRERAAGRQEHAEDLALAGGVKGGRAAALTAFAPMKAEWLGQYLEALWELLASVFAGGADKRPVVETAGAIARCTAAHHPAHLRLRTRDRALLPTGEGRIWSLYGGQHPRDDSGHAGDALSGVLHRLLTLQPEAAGHLRCLAYGPGAADLLVSQAVQLANRRIGRVTVSKFEIFCVEGNSGSRPRPDTLAAADDKVADEQRDMLEIRYLSSLDDAGRVLHPRSGEPAVHLALVTGLTEGGSKLTIESPEIRPPRTSQEVLFAPRIWQRPNVTRRTLLIPPTASETGQRWLRLMNAVEDAWAGDEDLMPVPEIRTGSMDLAEDLQKIHEMALWVATLDRYATRDSLEQALGEDEVAILHQERRLGGESPLSLVLSQKSGGPADRAIGRSLRAAGIVRERDVALSIGTEIRRVASQGYGILALEAATTGAGINELVGHVVAFSLLATRATPWPLPPGCRVLLVSLDDYHQWFLGKRADLLAIALDPGEEGVHVAAIEVKARRSDEEIAFSDALDQLRQTLTATQWAAYPDADSVYSRLWLNHIAEAAYSVARESRFRLTAEEIEALERFRSGTGTLEWAGVGLIFGPQVRENDRHYPHPVAEDRVPIVIHSIRLTEDLLRTATGVRLAELRTVEAASPRLQGGRVRRRPEAKPQSERQGATGHREQRTRPTVPEEAPEAGARKPTEQPSAPPGHEEERGQPRSSGEGGVGVAPSGVHTDTQPFVAPLLGWDATTGSEVPWHPAGPGQTVLQNGHIEIWGSSGMGKTQFTMALLAQLSRNSGSRFGITDFKNDYGPDSGFPKMARADFLDLWEQGAPYNPLALDEHTERAIRAATIELRDAVVVAAGSFVRMGHRQGNKLGKALQEAYRIGGQEEHWPTLRTLHDLLDSDLLAIMGDLTANDLFRDGPPLGEVIDRNTVFGLSKIPGNGQTTVLAAGFILAALLLRVQALPPIPNTIRYVVVVDEAHRVAAFKAIESMIREGRSKGLAVILATQQPGDLPDFVATNAQTKICFRLPDAIVAAAAARRLDPNDPGLPEQIRTLGVGEALVSLGGGSPQLVFMAQAFRDGERLGLLEEADG
jgi:hypothetical protein